MVLPIAVSFITLCVSLLLHMLIWHYSLIKERGVLLIIQISMLAYIVVAGFTMFKFRIGLQDHFWISCPLFMLFVMLYLHFYAGIDRSVSIRLLGELAQSKSGKMSLKEIQLKYPKEYMVKHRVSLLVKSNWLSEVDGKYVCTPIGSFVARLEIILKRLYRLDLTG